MLALQPLLSRAWTPNVSLAQQAWRRSFIWFSLDRILAWQPLAKRVWARIMSTSSQARWRSLSFSFLDKLCTRNWSWVWFSLLTLHPLLTRAEATNMSFSWKACRRRHICISFDRMLALQPFSRRRWTTNMSTLWPVSWKLVRIMSTPLQVR